MGYLFETHLHTSEGSACARSSAVEMVRAHSAAGYAGIVVTDHFFNGNTAVPRDLPWDERVRRFAAGWENALSEGMRLGMTVLFGFEFAADGAEFLAYGIEPDFLFANPDLDRFSIRRFTDAVRAAGGITSLAHPFREASHLYGIHLYQDTDAVEAVNAAHVNHPEFNRRAFEYAIDRGKPMTAGSDLHYAPDINGSGILFDREIRCGADFVSAVMRRECRLILRGEEYRYVPKNYTP